MEVMPTVTPPTTASEEDTDDPFPSAPPLYPILPAGTPPLSVMEPIDEEQTPVSTPTSSPMVKRSQSDFNMQRVRGLHVCVDIGMNSVCMTTMFNSLPFFLSLPFSLLFLLSLSFPLLSLSVRSNTHSLSRLPSSLRVSTAKW